MKTEIKYIELKSGFSDDGSAWIGLVTFSKSGKTLYFNNKAFQSLKGSGITGNYFDVESGDEYWISSVKKDLSDRHRFGGGKIYVERQILTEYLKILERTELPKNNYELIDIQTRTPKERINKLENKIHETSEFSDQIYTKNPKELTYDELESGQ